MQLPVPSSWPLPSGEAAHLLDEKEFAIARSLIAEYAGIKLSPHKRYMVHNRLSRRLRVLGLENFGDYLQFVQSDTAGEREAFVNALTTNLTAFFREPHHFELLRERAQHHRDRERRPLRVWCSACSTGEEAWSIAMTARDARCPAEILATDIDTDALRAAGAGIYPQERMSTLSSGQMSAHWLRGIGPNEGSVSARPELRNMVKFLQVNLQSPQWSPMESFDMIFCRNVVIYFDRDAQKKLLAHFTTVLRPHGLLVVGHAESFPASHPDFRACGRTAYAFIPN
jgi:chemotaxis protein methyltransferase CheR